MREIRKIIEDCEEGNWYLISIEIHYLLEKKRIIENILKEARRCVLEEGYYDESLYNIKEVQRITGYTDQRKAIDYLSSIEGVLESDVIKTEARDIRELKQILPEEELNKLKKQDFIKKMTTTVLEVK